MAVVGVGGSIDSTVRQAALAIFPCAQPDAKEVPLAPAGLLHLAGSDSCLYRWSREACQLESGFHNSAAGNTEVSRMTMLVQSGTFLKNSLCVVAWDFAVELETRTLKGAIANGRCLMDLQRFSFLRA